MFGLSTWEILIILAVALSFIGPDQLPKVARQIG
jgi:Sec-independent protein translocase protein TatA